MESILSYLTYANFISAYPWIINVFSITCAYMLSNNKVLIGRIIGSFAACNWVVFGYLTDQYAFIVSNIIFVSIYVSAAIRFASKRESYKRTAEENEAEMVRLTNDLNKKTRRAERKLHQKEERIVALSKSIIRNMEEVKNIAESR
jgi:hypothetical protein